ncbi:hypothetical protein ACSVH5_00735 [Flavobacterium sp. RSSA_27]|uniref:hypothetical protein n=1 Tax=Flavobacterium sp. RSSA_27 TaxID=3447667 RepID=UPI003F33D693
MKSFLLGFLAFFLMACEGKKTIQLPKDSRSVLTTIGEHSLIYFFFKTNNNDTIVDLNRNNTISSTHWVFTIDKRLPLRIVMPHIMKMQAKKEGSMHKNETSENYFSYADSLHKSLAFISFTNVKYNLAKPNSDIVVFFTKKNTIYCNESLKSREDVKQLLTGTEFKNKIISFAFDKNMSFELYIQNEIYLQSLNIKSNEEFIY